jgi:hypothetical protein
MVKYAICGCVVLATVLLGVEAKASFSDQQAVAKLDTEFQAAVKVNDAETMDRIMHKDMVLVLGNGTINTREEQLQEARHKDLVYEHQEEDPGTQIVRVWGRRPPASVAHRFGVFRHCIGVDEPV